MGEKEELPDKLFCKHARPWLNISQSWRSRQRYVREKEELADDDDDDVRVVVAKSRMRVAARWQTEKTGEGQEETRTWPISTASHQ